MVRILPHLAVALLGTAPVTLASSPALAPVAATAIVQAAADCDGSCCMDVCPVPACCDEACDASTSE